MNACAQAWHFTQLALRQFIMLITGVWADQSAGKPPPPPRPGAPGLEGEEAVVPAGQIDADAAGEEHQQAVGGVPVRGHDGAGGEEGGVHPQEELRRRDSVMGT